MGQYSLLVDYFTIGYSRLINNEHNYLVVQVRNTTEAVHEAKYTPWP